MTNQDAGTLESCGDGGWRIHFARHLPHPPSRVWAALVEEEQQERWLPGVTVDATEGGTVVFDFGEEETVAGKVLAVEPGHLLEHDWLWPDEPPSTVRWELTGEDGATVLVLRHEPVRREPAADHCTGWHAMLDALAVQLSGGDPGELVPDYERLHELYNLD